MIHVNMIDPAAAATTAGFSMLARHHILVPVDPLSQSGTRKRGFRRVQLALIAHSQLLHIHRL